MRERQSKDGTITFQVLFRDGSRQRSKTFTTAKAAQAFADKLRVNGVKRTLYEVGDDPNGLTLDELAEKYWPWAAARHRSDRTVHDYQRDYTNWIKRDLGYRVASGIDEADVQEWVDSMRGRLSAKSIADRHAILHGIYKFGSSPTRRLIPTGHNPTIGTDLPKKVKKQPKGLRPAEWQALAAALTQINTDAGDLAEFLVASGWRWSEATALTTHDVEDDGRYMHVTVSQVARRDATGATQIVQDAKSKAGLRRLKLDADISVMIRRRLADLEPGAFLFTTTDGSVWNYSHFRSRFWRKAIKAANLQRTPTIHWLRHTAVGLMDAAGIQMTEIQRRVGHESIQTTIDVYGGMIDSVRDESLDRMAELRNAKPVELTGTADVVIEADEAD